MRRTWVQIDGVLYEKGAVPIPEKDTGPTILPDLPGYVSPVTGLWVEGRKARREDLKRSNSREWEGMKAEKQEAANQRAYQDQVYERKLDEAASRAYYELPASKRDALKRMR